MYFLKIGYGNPVTVIGYSAIHGSYAELATSNRMKSDVIPPNCNVSVAIQTANGGSDTMEFWIQYMEM